jgi:hypothetical protein
MAVLFGQQMTLTPFREGRAKGSNWLPQCPSPQRGFSFCSTGRTNRVRCEPVSAAVENRPAMYPQNADLNLVKVSKQVAG